MKINLSLILSALLIVNPAIQNVVIAETINQQTTNINEENTALQLLKEGVLLYQQNTAISLKQSLEKLQQSLVIWRKLGNQSQAAVTLQSIGLVYSLLGDTQKCLEYYQSAVKIYQTIGDRPSTALLLFSLGEVYFNIGKKQTALDYFNQSLSIFKEVKNIYFQGRLLTKIGSIYVELGEKQKGLNFLNQALNLQKQQKNKLGEAEIWQSLGMIYLKLGENNLALTSLNQALSIFRNNQDALNEGLTLFFLGSLYLSTGKDAESLQSYNQALAIFKAKNDLAYQAIILLSIGGIYRNKEDGKKTAINYYQEALKLEEQLGNINLKATIFNELGLLYLEIGETKESLKYYDQALNLHRQENKPERVAFVLNSMASIYNILGENQQALDTYNQALQIQTQIQDKIGEGNTLIYIANVYFSLGDYQRSLETYNQALLIFRKIGDRTNQIITLDKITNVYKYLGDYPQALAFNKQALTLVQEMKNPQQEISILSTLVRLNEELKNYQLALINAQKIVEIGKKIDNLFLTGTGLVQTGRIYLALGENEKALTVINQGIALFNQAKNPFATSLALDNLGKVYQALNQNENAINAYNQALKLKQNIGDLPGVAHTIYSIAFMERKRGNLTQALTQIESALTIIESLRTKVGSQELRTSFFASVQKYYEFYINLLMELHKENPKLGYNIKALIASEKSRARSLIDLLNEARADIRTGVDPQLLLEEKELQQKINLLSEKQIKLLSGNYEEKQLNEVKQEINTLLNKYEQLQVKIRITSPKYAALTQTPSLSLKEIQTQLIDDNTLILEYSLGEEKSYLWLISKNSIDSYELPKREQIEAKVKDFRQQITNSSTSKQKFTQVSTKLSEIILAPVAEKLGNKRLLIVSDGGLNYVPFGALILSEKEQLPLLAKNEIINLPSLTTLDILRQENKGKKPPSKTLAVIADPVFSNDDERLDKNNKLKPSLPVELARVSREEGINLERLPGSRQEAQNILKFVPKNQQKQAFDFEANINTAKSSELNEYKIIHFATHGIMNSQNPELSGIVLSLFDQQNKPQNGFLRLRDIYNLNLSAELVVLSACQTGLGKEIKGEGLIGLTRGFMYAGSPRVIVSLWSVDDAATAELMSKFYQKMLKEGLKPGAALRAAQLELLQQQKWQLPYYWGAFILQGEWK